ncbi:serine hydrolase [Glycomyces paridis]|uniref:Serine hydrolase n=1 Tax=Glycomyces paridis TaxID=2126555 RepID=A0A4S8P2B8_9ACTN|nr:serine hydrolase [Glycomyces paridis]THV23445.1 serine hydrolase [Glycomyces paridis]
MQRRDVVKIGAGLAVASAAVVGTASPAQAATIQDKAALVKAAFDTEIAKAGGTWQAKITLFDGATAVTAVDRSSKTVKPAASMNKLGIAIAVLDKVDRGELSLEDRVTLTSDIILTGSGFYFHQTKYGDELTVANILVAMLLVSDNTSVRLCGLVCPPAEINETLAAKGFVNTRVIPNPDNPSRMWLGDTTAKETNDMFRGLVNGKFLSASSTRFLTNVLRGLSGYHDGFRHDMSSAERARVAVKYGADDANRNESGVIYNASGVPVVVYALMAQLSSDQGNYGATHPVVKAHAALGRQILDIMDGA